MGSKRIIKDLYVSYIEDEKILPNCYFLYERVSRNVKEIEKIIGKKHKKRLDLLCGDYEKINVNEKEEAFTSGFAYAVKMMAEAYGHK